MLRSTTFNKEKASQMPDDMMEKDGETVRVSEEKIYNVPSRKEGKDRLSEECHASVRSHDL